MTCAMESNKKSTVASRVALLLALVATMALAEESPLRCPEFPAPRTGRLEWVAPNLKYTGVPMQIKELVTEQTPGQVIDFYKAQWGSVPPYYHEYDVGEWKAIATLRQRCFYTVQVKPDGKGARALLGVSARTNGWQPHQAGRGFPAPAGSRVVNDIDHFDEGKTARTLLIMNNLSPETNADYYRRALKSDGWSAIVDRSVPGARGLSRVMVLKHGHHEANLTISPASGGSNILVTQVDRP
jgi:hypothetical protein